MRKEKRGRKREWLKKQKSAGAEAETPEDKALDELDDDSEVENDWEELKAEERAAKKIKRTKKEEPEMVASYDDL